MPVTASFLTMRPPISISASRRCLLAISNSQYTAAVSQVSQGHNLTRLPRAPSSFTRSFSVSSPTELKRTQMPSRPKPPPEDELDEMFVKGTGPGGQKINKTNSAVQIRHRPTGIVVKSQATRSRSENRAIARNILAARLDELNNGAQSRTAIVAASKIKKKANAMKKARRKYRKLEEEKGEKEGAVSTSSGEAGEVVKATKSTVLMAGAAAFMASDTVTVESSEVLTDADILQRVADLRQTDQFEGKEEDEDDEVDVVIEEEDEYEEEEEEDEYDDEEDEGEEDNGEEVWKVEDESTRAEEKAKTK